MAEIPNKELAGNCEKLYKQILDKLENDKEDNITKGELATFLITIYARQLELEQRIAYNSLFSL